MLFLSYVKSFQKYILALAARIDELTGEGVQEEPNVQQDSSSASEDYIETYLAELFCEYGENLNPSPSSNNDSFHAEIVKLESSPKVPITPDSFDIIKHWKQRKLSNPKMYRIAMALLSIPSTQVTVERTFSQLKLVLTDLRSRLSDKSIKDIMLLKMNKNLWTHMIDLLDEDLTIKRSESQ